MNRRRLVIGIGIMLMLIGGLLVTFMPGGIFNRGASARIVTPLGTLDVREQQSHSPSLITGYVLLGIGGLAIATGVAMK